MGAAVSDSVRVETCASLEVDGASVEASGALVAEAPQANKPKTTAIIGKANIRDIFRLSPTALWDGLQYLIYADTPGIPAL